MDSNQNQLIPSGKVSGNILFFYMADVGDDIDTDVIKEKNLLKTSDIHLSPFFKYYHIPLSFHMKESYSESELGAQGYSLFRKIYNFGVISFCYRVPFEESLEDLKHKIIEIKRHIDTLCRGETKEVYDKILPTIKEPHFYNIESSYFAVQVNPLKDKKITANDFKERFGNKIASLLRLELQSLSEYQVTDILSSSTGYYGQDMIIVDTDGAFIYDDEFFEPLEFFESANIEKLELQYFDRFLDKKLNHFYAERAYKVPLVAYIPLVSARLDLPILRLAKWRVDISVETERLQNSVKLAGDTYFSNVYELLVRRFLLREWRESINKKLDIIKDLYTVFQDRLDTIRAEMLEIIIIILIAIEIIR